MSYLVEYLKFLLGYETSNFKKLKLLSDFLYKNLKLTVKRILLNLKKYSDFKLVDRIDDLDCKKELLYKKSERYNSITKPYLYNKTNICNELNGIVPDVEICLLKNIDVLAKTSSLITNEQIYKHYLSKMKVFHDLKNPLNQVVTSFSAKNVAIYLKNNIEINEEYCIHLMNEHSNNYYHFMFELLPKFILISEVLTSNEDLSHLDYTILLDENIPKQFLEAIEYFSVIKYKVRFVPKHTKLQCENLVFCTDLWTSLDNTKFVPNIIDEFFVDRFACELVKSKPQIKSVVPNRKIYFQRKSKQARYLSNTDELEVLLKSLDFEFILPETLSFGEQIKVFNEAKTIIGISGTVFSNIIFMQKHTNAIIFSPDTVAANYYVFQPMADIADVNLTHILTQNNFQDSIHANSSIDINEVSSFLKSLDNK